VAVKHTLEKSTYTNYYAIWGSLNLTTLSVRPVDCDDDGDDDDDDDDFSVRSLRPWKLYVHLHTRLFPLQPRIPSIRVSILKTKNFSNTSGLIHIHTIQKLTKAKDSPLFINLVWKLEILHPLLSPITKFVFLPISGLRHLSDKQRTPSYVITFTLKFSRTKSSQNSAVALLIICITTDIKAILDQVDCQVKNTTFFKDWKKQVRVRTRRYEAACHPWTSTDTCHNIWMHCEMCPGHCAVTRSSPTD